MQRTDSQGCKKTVSKGLRPSASFRSQASKVCPINGESAKNKNGLIDAP
jgi:hypothetical protein